MAWTSYDSTWEGYDDDDDDDDDDSIEEEQLSTNQVNGRRNAQAQEATRLLRTGRSRYEYINSSAARDMQNYRHGYRNSWSHNQDDSEREMPNLRFYRNQIEFKPNGYYIDELLRTWKNDYDVLEYNHSYIQWLFPLRERGVNPRASPLHKQELQMMKKDPMVIKRLLESYKLMLGFYGLRLSNEETGKVCRAENWKERYENLNNHTHNNLRITRILKCLGELGFKHYQAPLVQLFLEETLCKGQLNRVKRSVLDYFVFSVINKRERQNLVYFAWTHYKPQDKFVWGPVDLLRKYKEPLKEPKREDYGIIGKTLGEVDNHEDKKEPQRKNNEDDRKQNKRKDGGSREGDVPKYRKKSGQDGVYEQWQGETPYNNKPYGDDSKEERQEYKQEHWKEEKIICGTENSQQGERENGKVETPCDNETQRVDSGDDRTECKREDNEEHFGKKNGQDNMKGRGEAETTYPNKPPRTYSGNDQRTHRMEDREERKIEKTMKEHGEGETPNTKKPQRKHSGDDWEAQRMGDREEGKIEKPISDNDMKEHGDAETTSPNKPPRTYSRNDQTTHRMEDREERKTEKTISQYDKKGHGEAETSHLNKLQRKDGEDDSGIHKMEDQIRPSNEDSVNSCSCLSRISWLWCKKNKE